MATQLSNYQPKIVILGAGPAGLAAAHQLSRRGIFPTVVEAQDRVGGHAGSFRFADMWVDYGSHRLHPSCNPAILNDIEAMLGDDLLVRQRHGRIRLQDRWLKFPISPVDLLRTLPARTSLQFGRDLVRRHLGTSQTPSQAAKSRWDSNEQPHSTQGPEASPSATTFASELTTRFGSTLCEQFYFPYARKLWGLDPYEISAVQAQKRVKHTSLMGIAADAVRKQIRKATGTPGFFYPRNGFGQISRAYHCEASRNGAKFMMGDPVKEIHHTSGQITGIVTHSGQEINADLCLSTLPIATLARLATPSPSPNVVDCASRLRMRSMVLVYLELDVDRFSEWDAHYLPGESLTCSRISEPKWYRGGGEPYGRTVLCAELPCQRNDSLWSSDDSVIVKQVVDDLDRCELDAQNLVARHKVVRAANVYPIYDVDYQDSLNRLQEWTQTVDNLVSFGRQGLFVHDNSHHALEMGYVVAQSIDRNGKFDHNIWRAALARFSENTVED